MMRFLVRGVVFFATCAIGLLIASWLLEDFRVSASGFVTAVVVFALAQSILSPFILNLTRKYAPALLGGFGLVSTLVALILASTLTDGLTIRGATTWVLGTFMVWIVTALGTWLVPLAIFKKYFSGSTAPRAAMRPH
jgi:uncharacterized membrane protein YvlD (DUF360 family)